MFSSHLRSTFDNESNYLHSLGLATVHSLRNDSLTRETLSVFHESLGFQDDKSFNHIQQAEDRTRSLQNWYLEGKQGSAKISNRVKSNTESDNPIFPYVVPTDVLFNKAGYHLLAPSSGVTIADRELSQPESSPTTSSASSNDSTLSPEESSLKPRRYILTPISLIGIGGE